MTTGTNSKTLKSAIAVIRSCTLGHCTYKMKLRACVCVYAWIECYADEVRTNAVPTFLTNKVQKVRVMAKHFYVQFFLAVVSSPDDVF